MLTANVDKSKCDLNATATTIAEPLKSVIKATVLTHADLKGAASMPDANTHSMMLVATVYLVTLEIQPSNAGHVSYTM